MKLAMNESTLVNFINDYEPDVACISCIKSDEISQKAYDVESKIPKEYSSFYYFFKPPKKSKFGTAVYTKVKPINVTYGFESEVLNEEGRLITCEFPKFFLVNCFTPESGTSKELDEEKIDIASLQTKKSPNKFQFRTEQWDQEFRKHVKKLEEKGKPVVIVGELNVIHSELDMYEIERKVMPAGLRNEERENFIDLLDSGFADTFRRLYPDQTKYTNFPKDTISRTLDKGIRTSYALVSNSMFDKVVDSGIEHRIYGSLYAPIVLTLNYVIYPKF